VFYLNTERGKNEDPQNDAAKPLQSFFKKGKLIAEVFNCSPCPTEIFSLDGTALFMNRAALAEYEVPDPEAIIGKYNIFRDSSRDVAGWVKTAIKRVFQGETVVFQNIEVPPEEIKKRCGMHDPDLEALYRDVTVFPVPDEAGQTAYFVVFAANRRVYRCREGLTRAKEYLEAHWMEKFNADMAANEAGLSRAQFTRLFKKHLGMTPHKYYTQYRIDKVKDFVRDSGLSIAEAFAACNMDYNGHFAKVFRNRVGLSPSAYRKHARMKNRKK
jgi:AraC-like DNA-binding protein